MNARPAFPNFQFCVVAVVIGACFYGGTSSVHAGEPEWIRLTDDGYFKQRPDWSRDGQRLLFTRHRGTTLRLIERTIASGEERRITKSDDTEADGVWSPDGKEIAFTFNKPQPNQSDIEVYRVRLADGELFQVAGNVKGLSHQEYPSWSSDGERIAFSSTHDGNQELYTARKDGSDLLRLTNDPGQDGHPAWSPSGDEIAFSTDRWGDLEIALIHADGSRLRRLTFSVGMDDFPAWSPDGKRLAFTSNRDGNREIYVIDVASGESQRRTDHRGIDDFPAWSPTGELTFISQRGGGFDVFMEPTR